MSNDGVENFVGAAPFTVSDYDYELGVRATIGTVPDCHSGYEATFVGPFRWTSRASAVDADVAGPLSALFDPVDIAFPNTFFDDPFSQTQRFEAELMSFELNRTLIGWEVIKLLYGVRYIEYDEEYRYSSQNAAGLGTLLSETDNRMIGGQVGIDLTFPVTCRLWSDFRARAGAYANFAENDFRLRNEGTYVAANADDGTELAGMFEIGGGARYYVTNNFHIRAGGELWYLAGVATAVDQFGSTITPRTGRNVEVEDDILMYGVSAGAEWKF